MSDEAFDQAGENIAWNRDNSNMLSKWLKNFDIDTNGSLTKQQIEEYFK